METYREARTEAGRGVRPASAAGRAMAADTPEDQERCVKTARHLDRDDPRDLQHRSFVHVPLRNGAVPHWALAPQPMSPAEVADLVERTRRACVEAQQRSQQSGTAGYQARARGPAAVRFVTERGWSVEDAAKFCGLTEKHVIKLIGSRP